MSSGFRVLFSLVLSRRGRRGVFARRWPASWGRLPARRGHSDDVGAADDAQRCESVLLSKQHGRTARIDGDHGRIETRTATVVHDVGWLRERHAWPGLAGIVILDSLREIDGRPEPETRLYITSLTLAAASLAAIIRDHWRVENSLHWVMDMVFRDDECRLRTEHAPANFTTIKHIALNLTRRAPGKDSLRLRRKIAAWDDEFLVSLIAA